MKRLNLVLAVAAIVIAGFTSSFGQNISDEARRHFDRGAAAVEMAKSPIDYEAAIIEFKQAIELAPEWADAYFNLGKVQEQAEKFADAIASLRQYLRLAPNASDVEAVKSLINKLQYKAENTLTNAVIISVLTSLSTWEVKGTCSPGAWSSSIKGADNNSIKVPYTLLMVAGVSSPMMSWKTQQVNGPTVRFEIIRNICSGGEVVLGDGKRHDCTEGYAVEVEVVSKTKVIERQVTTRTTDWGGEQIGDKAQCELSPPK